MVVRQFQGGFSNPTFHLQTRDRAYVLRKKPPGQLLPSAHAVDREYKVMNALKNTDVPGADACTCLCEDDSVIGTMFYVMDYVDGRVYTDRLLPGCTPQQRAEMYDAMNDVLAKLHRVDYKRSDLSDFGKPTGYVARQVSRWSKQYVASCVEDTPAMNQLMEWLPANQPARRRSNDRAWRLSHRQSAVSSHRIARRRRARLGALDDRSSARRSRLLLQRRTTRRARRARLFGSAICRLWAFRRRRNSSKAIAVASAARTSRTGSSSSCSRCSARRRFSPASIDAASTAKESTRAWQKPRSRTRISPRERGRSLRESNKRTEQ